MTAGITENVVVEVPFGPIGAALLLAEVYQLDGRLDEAIGLVQQLDTVTPDDPVIRLSLCDLLVADGDYDGALETSTGAVNDGDMGVATLHLRGAALFGQDEPGAAAEALTAALAKRADRDPDLLMAVRYDRALAYIAAGQTRKARADFEKIVAPIRGTSMFGIASRACPNGCVDRQRLDATGDAAFVLNARSMTSWRPPSESVAMIGTPAVARCLPWRSVTSKRPLPRLRILRSEALDLSATTSVTCLSLGAWTKLRPTIRRP